MKIIIIPTRMDSTRFPGKPLHEIAGKPLLQWTYERAKQTTADRVIVATCDRIIESYCIKMGIEFIPTDPNLQSGTFRCAAVWRDIIRKYDSDQIVNLQVDEPLVKIEDLNRLLTIRHSQNIHTLIAPLELSLATDQNIVKVAYSKTTERCHWFSRYPISLHQHIGVYSYPGRLLLGLTECPDSQHTKLENLEQLQWLDAGYLITGHKTIHAPLAINTLEDAEKMEKLIKDNRI